MNPILSFIENEVVFKHQDLQMFDLKWLQIWVGLMYTHLKLWVAIARHDLKWVIFFV